MAARAMTQVVDGRTQNIDKGTPWFYRQKIVVFYCESCINFTNALSFNR